MNTGILPQELRSALIDNFALYAPVWLKRGASKHIGLPLRPEVYRAGLIFIHVPKNAGTTISSALYGGHIGHRSARFYQACDPEFFESHPSFGLCRDPFTRFLSAWSFARKGGGAVVKMSRRAQEEVLRFREPLDYAEHLAALPEKLRAKCDPVFRPQASYLCDPKGRIMVDKVFRVEDVAGMHFDFAGRRFSMRQKINAGEGEKRPSVASPDALRKVLRTLYAQDYALFDYA